MSRHFPGLPAHPATSTPSAVSRVKLHPGLPGALEALVASRRAPPTATSAIEDWKLLVGDRERLGALDGVSAAELDALTGWARKQQRELDLRDHGEKDAEPWLDDEDHAILLRAYQLRVGSFKAKGGGPLRYAHIAVDEVQDFSPMEIAILLGACDTSRCITLAGDTQQHISLHGGSLRWDGLLGALGVEARELNTLRVSYRSTHAITAFARAVLGELAEDDAPPLGLRDGPPVDCFTFPEHGACVAFLGAALQELASAEPLASVALVARDAATARLYFEGLDGMDVPRLRLVEEQVFAFAPGVDVVDVAQVKGLEFDYVVILDASRGSWPDRGHDRRLLHVAATRAVHQLWVTAVGEIAPFVPSR